MSTLEDIVFPLKEVSAYLSLKVLSKFLFNKLMYFCWSVG